MDDQFSPEPRTDPRYVPGTPLRSPEMPPQRSARLIWILLLVVVAAGAGWYFWSKQSASPSGKKSQSQSSTGKAGRFSSNGAMPVAAELVRTGDMPIILNELGTVTPLANITVRTQIAGQLMQVAFKEGQYVTRGQFLAEVDPRPYKIQLEQAQGNLARDQALLRNAHLDLKRYTTLSQEDSIARQQVDTQASLVRQYEGTVKTDQAAIHTAQLNLIYCHITAPVSGRVGLRQVDAGNYVQTGDTNGVVVLTQTKPISVIFTVPEDNVTAIMSRVHGGNILPVTAFDRSLTTKLTTGNLATLDNTIDTSTGTVKLRADFANDNEILFPNQFVNIQLLVDTLQNVTLVPASAIQRGEKGTYVYVVNANKTVSVRQVTLGQAGVHDSVVQSGLQPGEQVVTDGADRLKDGAQIMLPAAGGSRAAAGQTTPSDAPGSAPGSGPVSTPNIAPAAAPAQPGH